MDCKPFSVPGLGGAGGVLALATLAWYSDFLEWDCLTIFLYASKSQPVLQIYQSCYQFGLEPGLFVDILMLRRFHT